MAYRVALAAVSASALLGAIAPPAAAIQCGEVNPQTKKRAKAVLVLDAKQAVTEAPFGRATGTRRLNLEFRVRGCELNPEVEERPEFDVLPKPDDAQQLDRPILKPEKPTLDEASFRQGFVVDAAAFKPGSYSGMLLLDAPYLVTNRTAVTVSRSEDEELIPAGLGALGGLIGILWFMALKLVARNKLAISWWWLLLVMPLAIGAGAYSVLNVYWDQDVWSIDENGWAALKAGFAGASTGAALGLLTSIFQSDQT